jgi:NADP-dependent alcohol dehydrogenase
MNNFTFYNPVKLVFGKGTIAELGMLVPKDAAVLMTFGGGTIKTNGVYDQVKAALKGVRLQEFGGIEPNPEYETLMRGVDLARKSKTDFLLSVGGGSVLDGTKFMAAAIPFQGANAWDIMEHKASVDAAVPLSCVLTLPATGSEMNRFAVISRRATGQKSVINYEKLLPQFSILDPQTAYSLPDRQVRNGIVDTWMHVVEQYLTYPVDAPLQDRQAEGILLTLLEEAPKVLANPRDYNVRANLMWCATHALNGLLGCGTVADWTTHRMGHELTVLYGIDHAQSLAILFPAVLRHEKAGKMTKLVQYGRRVFGIQDTDARTADAAIDKTVAFFHSIGMKTRLSDYNIPATDIAKIAARFTVRDKLGERQTIGVKEIVEILELCK